MDYKSLKLTFTTIKNILTYEFEIDYYNLNNLGEFLTNSTSQVIGNDMTNNTKIQQYKDFAITSNLGEFNETNMVKNKQILFFHALAVLKVLMTNRIPIQSRYSITQHDHSEAARILEIEFLLVDQQNDLEELLLKLEND